MPPPVSYYEFFRGLATARVEYLLTGAFALTLHGVPRLSPDVDLLVEPSEGNIARARERLAAWGYGERREADVLRLIHPTSPVGEIDLVLVPGEAYNALRARAATFHLIDVAIPAVSRDDLLRHKEASGRPQDRDDAESLRILESVLRGKEGGDPNDARRVQIVKFRRWHTENRCDWLLAANRLRRGLTPEQPPPREARLGRENPWRKR